MDLKDVNCHLRKGTVYKNAREERSSRGVGGGLLNVNYATSLSSNYSLSPPRKRRKDRGTNRFAEECRKQTVKKFLLPLKILTFHFFGIQATLIFFGSLVYADRLATRVEHYFVLNLLLAPAMQIMVR